MKRSLIARASLWTLLACGTAAAAPSPAPGALPLHDGAHAQVALSGAKTAAEQATARELETLLRGPLRGGVTGLVVADARTGEALFTSNPDEALNPASNVKMISTAAALELLGPEFRYPTRVYGPLPDEAGVLHGDVYLLGSYDPTLAAADLDELAAGLAARGVRRLDGDIVIGSDPTRDGLFRATIPVEITAAAPGKRPIARSIAEDLVTVEVTATTARAASAPHLVYKVAPAPAANGHARVVLTVAGVIGRGGKATYQLPSEEHTAAAAFTLRAALRAHGIDAPGGVKTEELGDFVGDSLGHGALPFELARHESAPLADIVAHVNKWSINWLADRVIMTAAALHDRTRPSMEGAVAAMYGWLARHAGVGRDQLVVDSGSGLSYHTQISTHELVSIVRGAAGFTAARGPAGGTTGTAAGVDSELAKAWLASLSIAGRDGTLTNRFHAADVRGFLRGKTGTLSTAIALSGVLDVDPDRPLVFSIVTNTKLPLSPGSVRKAHERMVAAIVRYLQRTAKHPTPVAAPVKSPIARPLVLAPADVLDAEPASDDDAR